MTQNPVYSCETDGCERPATRIVRGSEPTLYCPKCYAERVEDT